MGILIEEFGSCSYTFGGTPEEIEEQRREVYEKDPVYRKLADETLPDRNGLAKKLEKK